MTQTERIKKMELLMDETASAVSSLSEALETYRAAIPSLNELASYYEGGAWLADYDDDRAGKIPRDLKRGVLSEDALWNVLSDNRDVLELMKQIADAADANRANRSGEM